jgi:hypothetical protein
VESWRRRAPLETDGYRAASREEEKEASDAAPVSASGGAEQRGRGGESLSLSLVRIWEREGHTGGEVGKEERLGREKGVSASLPAYLTRLTITRREWPSRVHGGGGEQVRWRWGQACAEGGATFDGDGKKLRQS